MSCFPCTATTTSGSRSPTRSRACSRELAASGRELTPAFERFKGIADKKARVTAMDLEALVTDELREGLAAYPLEWLEVDASSRRPPHATVGVRLPDGEQAEGSFTGDG